jgi:hypothetical protein
VTGEVDEVRSALFPTEACSCLNEVNVELLLVFGGFSSEEGNFWSSTKSTEEHLNCFNNVRNPVFERVTKSEDVYSPSFDIVVLKRIHIFPGELQMFSKCEAVNVYFGCCSNHVSLSAKLFLPVFRKYLNSDSVDVVNFLVHKTHQNFLETVVRQTHQFFRIMRRFVAYVAYIDRSKFKKL